MQPTKKQTLISSKSCAILTGIQMHHLDHLAPLCSLLDIPLITDVKQIYITCKKYYPMVDIRLQEGVDFSLEYLAKNFDTIFTSSRFYAKELRLLLQMHGKEMQFIFCPHGNSDKGILNPEMDPFQDQESAFIYGNQMRKRIENLKCKPKNLFEIGNYRLHFYQKYKIFYDKIIRKEIACYFKEKRKVVLYAPTWQDMESSSSYFTVIDNLLRQVNDTFNLIVKPHPLLKEKYPSEIMILTEKYRDHESVLILEDFSLIYPLLNIVDVYLGDFSSIGYDFLYFRRPMLFCNPSKRADEGCFLHQCGITLKEDLSDFSHHIKGYEDTFQEKKKWIYNETFSNFSAKNNLY